MQEIRVRNTEKDELISDLMKQAAQCTGGKSCVSQLESRMEPGKKDLGLIEEFVIAVAKTVFLEAIKYVIKQMKKRRDYDGRKKIEIDGKIYTLRELDEEGEPDSEEKTR